MVKEEVVIKLLYNLITLSKFYWRKMSQAECHYWFKNVFVFSLNLTSETLIFCVVYF